MTREMMWKLESGIGVVAEALANHVAVIAVLNYRMLKKAVQQGRSR